MLLEVPDVVVGEVHNLSHGVQDQNVHVVIQHPLLMVVLHRQDAVHWNAQLITADLHLRNDEDKKGWLNLAWGMIFGSGQYNQDFAFQVDYIADVALHQPIACHVINCTYGHQRYSFIIWCDQLIYKIVSGRCEIWQCSQPGTWPLWNLISSAVIYLIFDCLAVVDSLHIPVHQLTSLVWHGHDNNLRDFCRRNV